MNLHDDYGPGNYDANIDPGLANEFSTVAFRVGHTLLSSDFPIAGMKLRDAFFQPDLLDDAMLTNALMGFCQNPAQQVDTKVVDDVRVHLFGKILCVLLCLNDASIQVFVLLLIPNLFRFLGPNTGNPIAGVGLDLVALNIQRGRDHGIPPYNALRQALGLTTKATFNDMSSDPSVVTALQDAYANVEDVDAWIGGLAEDHVDGGMVGELFNKIIGDQFKKLMYGDPFFHKRDQDLLDLAAIAGINLQTATLAECLANNAGLTINMNSNDTVMKMGATVTMRRN